MLNWGDGLSNPTFPTPSCALTSTGATIDNLFTQNYAFTTYWDITIQIDNIRNPLVSGVTGNFVASVPTVAQTQTIVGTGVGITATTMTCSVTTTPTTVNSNGVINIEFTTP